MILADLNKDWVPEEDRFQLGSFETRMRFPVCKLVRKLAEEWHEDQSLPVQVARAQVEGLKTAGDAEARYRAKWQLVRGFYAAGNNGEELREVFRVLDWMLHLREDLGRRFVQKLRALEEELHMPYVTSVERYAREDGLTEGLAKGFADGRAEGRAEGRTRAARTAARRANETSCYVSSRRCAANCPSL